MANTIRLKRASGSDPGASDLVTGELAVRTDTAKLFTKKDDNSVVEIGATVSSDAVDTAAIQDDAVTFAKIQNISQNKFAGRISSGTGNLEQLTAANVRSIINVEDGATADQSNSEIKTAYEANSNTNAFTDALLSKLNGIAASATNVTNNNQLTNGAGYITATLTNEQVQDIVGGMVSSNTESGITVTYQDSDGTLDFSVASQTDNNFTNADHSKLDGIEAGATADQTASEILTLIKTVDGAGSGLDADTLDGATSSFFQNASNLSSGTVPQARLSASTLLTLIKTVDGSGSGLDADSLDGLNSTAFVRSNASDTLTGSTYTFNSSEAEKIILQGASNPYIRFQEGTTDKAYVQWHSDGYLQLANAEDGSRIRIKDDLRFTTDNFSSTNYKIWHAGNDGSGSGLDADLLDGLNAAESGNSARIVRTNASGYIFANYINTTDNTVSSGVSDIMCKIRSGSQNNRSANAAAVRAFINVENGATADQSASEILTLIKTVDGAGSGLDADTLDGISSASFARSDANDTLSGIITLSSTSRDCLNFSGGAGDDNRGIAFNGRIALSADQNDGYLRLNNASEFGNGVYTPGVMRADNGFQVDGTTVINGSAQLIASRLTGSLPAIDGSNLTGISAGATGGGSDEVFYENGQTVTTNYTITNGKNAMAAGPITINSGVTVTVGSGETLTIV